MSTLTVDRFVSMLLVPFEVEMLMSRMILVFIVPDLGQLFEMNDIAFNFFDYLYPKKQ